MEIVELIGLVLAFAAITLIDKPKLKATANKTKYSVVYYLIVIAGILVGMLKIFQIIPDYDKSLAFFFQKMTGIK